LLVLSLKTQVGKDIAVGDDAGQRSDVAADNPVPTPPFWGTRVIRDIPLDEVFDLLDLDELYRLQWGARGSGEQYDKTVKNEFEPALERLKKDAIANGWIKPASVYGYFPAQSQGNDVIVYDPAAYASDGASLREIARFKRGESAPPSEEDRQILQDLTGWPFEQLWGKNPVRTSSQRAPGVEIANR